MISWDDDFEARLRKLQLFPTPPWATRTLFEYVLPLTLGLSAHPARITSCWEPAAGLGHMAETIKEYCANVLMSDVANYPLDDGSLMSDHDLALGDFLAGQTFDAELPDWIITNPPFRQTEAFLQRALKQASKGVALLQKQTWLTGGERYEQVYVGTPPDLVAQFIERVPMCLGGYDPRGSTATDYSWFIWLQAEERRRAAKWLEIVRANMPSGIFPLLLIPPGRRDAYFRASDLELAERRRLPGWHPDAKVRKLRRRIHAERDARLKGEETPRAVGLDRSERQK